MKTHINKPYQEGQISWTEFLCGAHNRSSVFTRQKAIENIVIANNLNEVQAAMDPARNIPNLCRSCGILYNYRLDNMIIDLQ